MKIVIRGWHLLGAGIGLVALAATWALWPRVFPPEPPPAPPRLADVAAEPEVQDMARVLLLLDAVARCQAAGDCDPLGPFRSSVVAEARDQLELPDPDFRDDCSGYVSAVFTAVGVPMDGIVVSIWDSAVRYDALHWGLPHPGDLVFFEHTYDRELDERTHIGIVLAVEADGTATFAHAGTSSGRQLGRINTFRPSVYQEGGRTLNSYLREPEPGDDPTQGYLAGELFTAFATVSPDQDWRSPP